MRNKCNEQFEMVVSTGVVMVPSTGSGTEETVVELVFISVPSTGSGTEETVVELVETTEGTTFNKI